MGTVAGILFGLLFVGVAVVAAALRMGLVNRRFGYWLDARIYAVFPRLGHLFLEEREGDE
jgi:hypothetical protein